MLLFVPILTFLGCPDTKDDEDDTEDTPGGGGGGDRVSDCATSACGGDAVGDWTIGSVCYTGAQEPLDDCPSGYSQVTDVTIVGTLSIAADGTYTSGTTQTSFSVDVRLPEDCTGGLDCSVIEASMGGDFVCGEDLDGGCLCAATYTGEPDTDSGTWSASGNEITITSDDPESEPSTQPYCADSDELWIGAPEGEDDMFSGFLLTK